MLITRFLQSSLFLFTLKCYLSSTYRHCSCAQGSVCSTDVSWEAVEEREAQPVLWVPDHAVTRCMGCDSQFWLGRRKHHCRYIFFPLYKHGLQNNQTSCLTTRLWKKTAREKRKTNRATRKLFLMKSHSEENLQYFMETESTMKGKEKLINNSYAYLPRFQNSQTEVKVILLQFSVLK